MQNQTASYQVHGALATKRELEGTVELAGPELGCKVEVGFGVDVDGVPFLDDIKEELSKGDDSEEDFGLERKGVARIDVNRVITGVFVSKTGSRVSLLAAMSEGSFSIYCVWEELSSEYELRWTVDYRRHPKLSTVGHMTSIDFARSGERFVAATTLGYLCFFSLSERRLVDLYQVQLLGV